MLTCRPSNFTRHAPHPAPCQLHCPPQRCCIHVGNPHASHAAADALATHRLHQDPRPTRMAFASTPGGAPEGLLLLLGCSPGAPVSSSMKSPNSSSSSTKSPGSSCLARVASSRSSSMKPAAPQANFNSLVNRFGVKSKVAEHDRSTLKPVLSPKCPTNASPVCVGVV